MKVYLGDLVHNMTSGGNVLTGKNDFVVPTNIGNIGAYAKKMLENKIDLHLFKYPSELLATLENDPPAVLGLSNYAWNAELNMQISKYIKKYYPETLIVIGGPSIRTAPNDLLNFLKLHREIDVYVMYDGEKPFTDFLKCVYEYGPNLRDIEKDRIKNIAYLIKDNLHYTLSSELFPLENLPSPYLAGLMDKFLERDLIPLFETNRGCPFSCTYCTWGISFLKKIRKFPIERIFSEMGYVAKKFPNLPVWIFADANFGILDRDIKIAEEIRNIKKRTTSLKTIITWDSKNNYENTCKIAEIIGQSDDTRRISSSNKACVAIQHLSPKVLRAIKRNSIDLKDLSMIVGNLHKKGMKVTTDVLYGLPTETLQDALTTLRQCFEIKFDYINLTRTLMLRGSELEASKSREQFELKTKYMIRRGSYGEYATKHGKLRVIELDELITSTSTFAESEMIYFQLLQWLVFHCYNHGTLTPLLKYLMNEYNINPADFLIGIIENNKTNFPYVNDFFINFRHEIQSSTFEIPETMHDYYHKKENWKSLLDYIRIELRYNALMYSNQLIREEFYKYIDYLLDDLNKDKGLIDILKYIRENYINVHLIMDGKYIDEKEIKIIGKALKYIIGKSQVDYSDEENYSITLFKSSKDQNIIKDFLSKHHYNKNPINAIERLIGANFQSLSFDIELQAFKTPYINS